MKRKNEKRRKVFIFFAKKSAGRGTHTHAHTHSLMCDHHVFINLETLKFYCLPDNYEVIDPSLEDIRVCMAMLEPPCLVISLVGLSVSHRSLLQTVLFAAPLW